MARRKKLILAEFAVTVWEDRVDWGGLDAVLWRLLHAKPASGFLPQLRAIRGRRGPRPSPSK